ncbi:YycH family regulatory protein [Companilactobacillus sp. RD055328]|uniref:YycH family regulatory protein n=1 Tax=Companilactobacillus sp. RD055328 TaxID=2916634 RepID=UPI001FC7E475|nr:hypothetical protein [Companilactobacillus sp. RD055328]
MKISRLIVQTLVVVAIAISFVLSFLILTNNSRYQMQPKTDVAEKKSSKQNVVQKEELYSPSQIIWNDGTDQRLVYNNKHNVVKSVQKDMSTWKFGKVSVLSKNNTEKYKKFVNSKDSLQLFYPLQMSVSYYGDLLKQDNLSKEDKYMFNRVLFHFDHKDKNIYLGNDRNHTVYKLSVNSGSSEEIVKLLKNTDISLKINLVVRDKTVSVDYVDHVVMNTYSYLVTKQEDNNYVSNLLGSNNISTRQSGDTSTYSANSYQRLVSDSKKNQLTYYDYSKDDLPKSKTEMLNNGYKLINKINSPLSNAKLAYVDWKNRVLVYREYVEGFPTFKKSDIGAVKVSFQDSGTIAQFSNKVIQVPIPSDQKPVTLKNTAEIIEDLKNGGYTIDKIEDIDLGYEWTIDKDNSDVVDLSPSYFIRIGNKWSTLSELVGVSDRIGGS